MLTCSVFALLLLLYRESQCQPGTFTVAHTASTEATVAPSLTHTHTKIRGTLEQWLQPKRPEFPPAYRKECLGHVQRSCRCKGIIVSLLYRISHSEHNKISTKDHTGLSVNKLAYTDPRGPSLEAGAEVEEAHCTQGLDLPRMNATTAQVVTMLQTL